MMSPYVSGIGRACKGGLGAWDPSASLASAFLVLLRRWRASPTLALFPGVEVGCGTHPQSLWCEPWGAAASPLASCFWVVITHLGILSTGCERSPGARQVNWQLLSPHQAEPCSCTRCLSRSPFPAWVRLQGQPWGCEGLWHLGTDTTCVTQTSSSTTCSPALASSKVFAELQKIGLEGNTDIT